MKRYVELFMVLVVCALVVFYFGRRSEPELGSGTLKTKPSPTQSTAPTDAPLALNTVKIGDSLRELEKSLGPPDFSWPKSQSVQWEPRKGRFTRVFYRIEDSGEKFVIRVEASGVLTRGSQRLVGFGDPKERMLSLMGEPERIEDGKFYHYPGVKLYSRRLVGMITLEGEGANK